MTWIHHTTPPAPTLSKIRRLDIPLEMAYESVVGAGSWTVGRTIFDPSEYDRIEAAYLEVCGNVSAGGSVTVLVRNWTDGVNIPGSDITFTETSSLVKRSSDFKDSLPSTPKELAFRVDAILGTFEYRGGRLIIIQGLG